VDKISSKKLDLHMLRGSGYGILRERVGPQTNKLEEEKGEERNKEGEDVVRGRGQWEHLQR
jgi:hypothetical protein